MEMNFENQTFSKRFRSMLKVDFKRMFTTPLVYIVSGISFILPILILVMTSFMGGKAETSTSDSIAVGFTNVWQVIGSLGGNEIAMDLTGMCNINLLFFLTSVITCLFVGADFTSGYVKNLFTVRAKKIDYIFSKTLVNFICAKIVFLAFFVGAMIGGSISGLSFSTESFGAGGVVACLLSKIFISLIFVSFGVLFGAVAKQKLWLSILCSLGLGALLFTTIPMIAPLNAGFLNVILSLFGSALLAIGFGALSNVILKKTNLV